MWHLRYEDIRFSSERSTFWKYKLSLKRILSLLPPISLLEDKLKTVLEDTEASIGKQFCLNKSPSHLSIYIQIYLDANTICIQTHTRTHIHTHKWIQTEFLNQVKVHLSTCHPVPSTPMFHSKLDISNQHIMLLSVEMIIYIRSFTPMFNNCPIAFPR